MGEDGVGGVRLNLGCGARTPPGWIHVDWFIGARLLRVPVLGRVLRALGVFGIDWSREISLHDLRRPFPWDDDSVDAIYSSHTLEHLTAADGARFLHECHRVLRPGGVLRIVVPDLRLIVERYRRGELAAVDFLDQLSVSWDAPGDTRLKRWLAPFVRYPHRCMYDGAALPAAMAAAGFDTDLCEAFESRIADIAAIELESRTRDAVIAEGIAPGMRGQGSQGT